MSDSRSASVCLIAQPDADEAGDFGRLDPFVRGSGEMGHELAQDGIKPDGDVGRDGVAC